MANLNDILLWRRGADPTISCLKLDRGSHKYTFLLRQNVTFHDGAIWDCAAAKLNLDHVLAEVLRTPDWHGWYGVPKYIKDWECTDEK